MYFLKLKGQLGTLFRKKKFPFLLGALVVGGRIVVVNGYLLTTW